MSSDLVNVNIHPGTSGTEVFVAPNSTDTAAFVKKKLEEAGFTVAPQPPKDDGSQRFILTKNGTDPVVTNVKAALQDVEEIRVTSDKT